ncbi:MAG: ABC transporter substrate-binding protein [Gammaproteobacteria bacterium]|jgi:ABC-type branched-subunit amino acid transport system substrate-binding protein|nr:ABC transporter substrate-binding protein [Gammaproteobacteria bacterium]MBU0786754.1 ABC transporter substrate-binding protein [Gammaproteobacteria bacterium]MBU0814040.1 ABC transporter substrate-binding protein [Gammaproteobacteria bacterium]MBU1788487.1 ABC transporter substrate-binding protein [Gammaproteobacteria bacterium]
MRHGQSIWGALLLAVFCASANAQILIGQTAGFSGPVAAGVKETTDGAKLYIDMVNAKGGVNGQKIELLSLDDKFDPKLAAENARKLIEEQNVVAMFLNRGTPHSQAIIPLLDKHGVALIAPSTGAMLLHQPVQKHVFNVRATYQREAEKAITHLATIGINKIALVYVDDSFGADGLAGAQKGMAAANLTPAVLEKFNRSKPDFSKIAPMIQQTGTQTVVMIASGAAVVDGIKAIRAAGSQAQIVTLSNNASGGFITSLGTNATGVIVTQVFPQSMSFSLVKEASDLVRANKDIKELSPAMLEGFAGAKVLVEGLRRAGAKPTREKIQTAMEGLNKFDIGGLEVSYSSKDHTGLDFADLSIISSSGKFRR